MKKTVLYLIVLPLSVFLGCENSSMTETLEPTGEQEWYSVVEEWMENAELSEEEEAILRERIEKAMIIKDEGLPKEIAEAWDKMKEDYKVILGVEELPKREIAPGTYSWVPEEYLQGEKREELYEFLSDRFKNLRILQYKHGLRENEILGKVQSSPDSQMSLIGDYDYSTFVSVSSNGSNKVQWGYDVWTFTDNYSSPPPYFMSQNGELTKGGVSFDTYDQSEYYTYTLGDFDWGGEYSQSMTCFRARTIHIVSSAPGTIELNAISEDFDCAWVF